MTDMDTIHWFIPALCTAFFAASQDAWVKRQFSHLSTYEMAAFPMVYSLPLFAMVLPLVTVPVLDETFLIYFLLSLPINGIGFYLHIRAIQLSPLSLTLPYLAFTPAFIFFTGFVILGEAANSWGILGVCTIVAGSYVLNLDPAVYSPLAPLRAFGREKGSVLMLGVAFIYGFGAVVGKKAILHSSVMFFSTSFFLGLNACFLVSMLFFKRIDFKRMINMPFKGVIAGGLLFAHVICHGWAISLTKAVYMIAVKRISILFGIIYGGVLFNEEHMLYRLLGTGLMIGGAVVVMFKGL